MTTYEEYLQLRRECGYDEDRAMISSVWNACEPEAQQNMLDQYRPLAAAMAQERAEQAAIQTARGPSWAAW